MLYRVILLLLLCPSVYGQIFNAAPFQGLGNTGVALKSIYSVTNNAAGLAGLLRPEVAIAYEPNFISSSISTQALFIAFPFQSDNVIGLGMRRYGVAGVSSLLTASGAYARAFGTIFSTSLSINYHTFSVLNYGKDQVFSVDLGVQLSLLETLSLGAVFRNISKEMFADDISQYIPREVGVGLKYKVSTDIFISSDVYYDPIQHLNFRGGVSYTRDKVVALRVGASSGPTQYYAGIGIDLKPFRIDCSSSFHAQLGSSPQIACSYVF